jgi:Ca-activated chloride channel family protein
MTRLRISVLLLLAVFLSVPAPPSAAGQAGPGQEAQDEQTELGALEVFLPVVVLNKKGQFVSNLTRQNFKVFEDGKEQQIESFDAPTQLPLHVAILLDTSASVKRKLKFEQDAAVDFVLSVLKGGKDQALFVTFDSQVVLHTDFTDDTGDLTRAIDKAKASGDTRLYDAVYRICEEKMLQLPAEGRPVIVVVTDGADTASDKTLDEAIEIAQRANVTIFGVSTRNYSDISAGMVRGSVDKELVKLCEKTGGRTFLPYQKLELARAFGEITKSLRNQYVIYYRPQNQNRDGKFREIRVEVDGVDEKVEVNAKSGYYALQQSADVVPR